MPGKPPVWRIETRAPGGAIPILHKLGFKRRKNGDWVVSCWNQRFYRGALKKIKAAGCHGRGYNIEIERRSQAIALERVKSENDLRVKTGAKARAADLKRQKQRRLTAEALMRAQSVVRQSRP